MIDSGEQDGKNLDLMTDRKWLDSGCKIATICR